MKINKSFVTLFVVIVVLVVGVALLTLRGRKPDQKITPADDESVEEIVPTVTSRTAVSLSYAVPQKEVMLAIKGIPEGTDSIEYELSYETNKQGAQGAIGTISTSSGTTYEKQITLGTCSSGTCVYHEVTGPIQVTLRFNGTYGQQLFQKGYDL